MTTPRSRIWLHPMSLDNVLWVLADAWYRLTWRRADKDPGGDRHRFRSERINLVDDYGEFSTWVWKCSRCGGIPRDQAEVDLPAEVPKNYNPYPLSPSCNEELVKRILAS